MRNFLGPKHILLFFLPLIFVTELHQISHTILHAFLARLADPKLTLAAFSIAFAFCVTLSTINQVSVQGGISFITDRVSFWRLLRFSGAISIILFLAVQSVALTPMTPSDAPGYWTCPPVLPAAATTTTPRERAWSMAR